MQMPFVSRSVSSLTLCIGVKRCRESCHAKIREEFFGEDPFGVGALPEEEVAGALLTGGADDKVDIGERGVIEVRAKCVMVRRAHHDTGLTMTRHPLYRSQDFIFAAVVDGE